MQPKVVVVFLVIAACGALPSPRDETVEAQNLLADAPGFSLRDVTGTAPDQDGFIKADVVSVTKRVMVFVHSTQTPEGAKRRDLIRNSWMQPLNRTSPSALPKELRKAISVWFVIPRDPTRGLENQTITAEGELHGDITLIGPRSNSSSSTLTRLDELGAVLRWIHVAYYQRFDFVLFTEDNAFVALDRLKNLCDKFLGSNADGGHAFIYAGFVNSFTSAPDSYHHKYYAPFAEHGTIVMSRAVTELLTREIGIVQPLNRYDATIGNFLVPYRFGKPIHVPTFIPNIKNTYEDVASPIVVIGVDEEQLASLSSGKPLPGAQKEMETRGVYINPYPKDDQPECHGGSGTGCQFRKDIEFM